MRRGVVSVLVVALFWVAVWFVATAILSARFEATVDAARAQGWAVAAGAPSRAGFPFTAAIVVRDASIGGGEALPGAGRADAARLVVSVALAHPLTLAIALPEGMQIRRPGFEPVEFHAAPLTGTAPLFGPSSVTIQGEGVTAASPGEPGVAVAHLRLVLVPRGPDLGFDLAATGLRLPGQAWALGPEIARLLLRGEAAGALGAPPANGVRGLAGWLEDWQHQGGRLTLADAALDWGTLALAGQGTLALDPALQPDASFALHVEGYDGALAALVRAGDMARGPAVAARLALGLLARGGKPGIDVTASLRNGELSVGGVSLGRVPEIHWPDAP